MKENCTNKALLELIKACPKLIEKLYQKARLDMIEAYDMVLGDYNMSFGTLPPEKGESWGYYYCIDGERYEMNSGVDIKTKAEAQLEVVNATRYKLNERIEKEARLRTH